MSDEYENQLFWQPIQYWPSKHEWFRFDDETGLWGTIQKNYGCTGFWPDSHLEQLINPQDNGSTNR